VLANVSAHRWRRRNWGAGVIGIGVVELSPFRVVQRITALLFSSINPPDRAASSGRGKISFAL
jgi:hypothetical protein